jgi:hypothetical protein
MANNLENIPRMLRIIARQVEKGELPGDVGVLTIRKKGVRRPVVFGFGAVGKWDHASELGRAAVEILRLSGVPEPTKEQTAAAISALAKL